MLGLKRGTVELVKHQEIWRDNAINAISKIKTVLGNVAIDIEHVGSTSINGIHAKPIIDIAVGVRAINDVEPYIDALERVGIIYRKHDADGQILFVMGDIETSIRTHHIHVVEWNSLAWCNYINFRDYLNTFPEKADTYDTLKLSLAAQFANDRGSYTSGKHELINHLLTEAKLWRSKQ